MCSAKVLKNYGSFIAKQKLFSLYLVLRFADVIVLQQSSLFKTAVYQTNDILVLAYTKPVSIVLFARSD